MLVHLNKCINSVNTAVTDCVSSVYERIAGIVASSLSNVYTGICRGTKSFRKSLKRCIKSVNTAVTDCVSSVYERIVGKKKVAASTVPSASSLFPGKVRRNEPQTNRTSLEASSQQKPVASPQSSAVSSAIRPKSVTDKPLTPQQEGELRLRRLIAPYRKTNL